MSISLESGTFLRLFCCTFTEERYEILVRFLICHGGPKNLSFRLIFVEQLTNVCDCTTKEK